MILPVTEVKLSLPSEDASRHLLPGETHDCTEIARWRTCEEAFERNLGRQENVIRAGKDCAGLVADSAGLLHVSTMASDCESASHTCQHE